MLKNTTKKMTPLKVGFDFDGVILYNPARIIRPFVFVFKKYILKKKTTKFYVPKSDIEKTIFKLFHLSSIFPAKGLEDIKTLVKEGKIEAYLITARYDFLREDLDKWIKKLDLAPYFVKIIHNEKNEQPHLYKERILSELGIEVFVEDNYDIVNHLSKKSPTKVFWLYNIFDRNSDSKEKYSSLKLAVNKIKTLIK